MSDQSDNQDPQSPDSASFQSERDADDSSIDQSNGFLLDLEAEESDRHGEDGDEEDEASEDYDEDLDGSEDVPRNNKQSSFPQFSRLPPELRTMIWEAADPSFSCESIVLRLCLVNYCGTLELWESTTLAAQTAPSRALLATNKESRRIALKRYPDILPLRNGRGDIRMRYSTDIVNAGLYMSPQYRLLAWSTSWGNRIEYLCLDLSDSRFFRDLDYFTSALFGTDRQPRGFKNLKALFYCFSRDAFSTNQLEWSVSESSKQHCVYAPPRDTGYDEEPAFKRLYCWPDPTLHNGFKDRVTAEFLEKFPYMPRVRAIPIWPMVEYSLEDNWGKRGYQTVDRMFKRLGAPEDSFISPLCTTDEGDSIIDDNSNDEFDDSEPDDHYSLDSFVVDGTDDEGGGSSNEGNDSDGENDSDRVNEHPDSSDHDDSVDEGPDEVAAHLDLYPDTFNGFSPIEGRSEDEEAIELANSAIDIVTSPEGHISDASSLDERAPTAKAPGRLKRRIVLSDDEDEREHGAETESYPRVKRRARAILSDSDDDEDDNTKGVGREVADYSVKITEGVEDDGESQDDENEDNDVENKDQDDESEDQDDESEGQDDEDSVKPLVSKPTSLLARLRQFRSDVSVSPEGNSTEEDPDTDDDDGEQRLSDAEFPESAEEYDEEGEDIW